MGTRTFSYYDCPKCGTKDGVEIYDHFSAMMYVESCSECDYYVDLDYYEVEKNIFELLSKSKARDRGYLCNKCDGYLYIEDRDEGICEECRK